MGNTPNRHVSGSEAKYENKVNKKVTKLLNIDGKADARLIKILLLGTGDSGKSTMFKQARRLGGQDLKDSELLAFVLPVMQNILSQAQGMITAVKALEINFANPDSLRGAEVINQAELSELKAKGVSKDLADAILQVWRDDGVKEAWKRRAEFQLLDCADYFFKEDVLRRISTAGKKYSPTFEDSLNCRNRSSGISAQRLTWRNSVFMLFDVGGQRSERKKWISCFDSVTTVIFVTAISEYDQKLFEDQKVNRIDESHQVWEDIVNRDDFKEVGFILFLNKWDVFQKKILEIPYRVTEGEDKRNEDYEGDNACECDTLKAQDEAVFKSYSHLKNKFADCVSIDKKQDVAIHRTIATESETFNQVFTTTVSSILTKTFNAWGI